jgi:hypothetical protein
VPYRTLPTKWLEAIVAEGMDWTGNPQQTGSWRPGDPELMLKARNHVWKVGQPMTVRGVACRVTKILPAGTVEVEAVDGSGAWRVSGLGVL